MFRRRGMVAFMLVQMLCKGAFVTAFHSICTELEKNMRKFSKKCLTAYRESCYSKKAMEGLFFMPRI